MDICKDCSLMKRYSRLQDSCTTARKYDCIHQDSPHGAMAECSAYIEKKASSKSDACETKHDLLSVVTALTECVCDAQRDQYYLDGWYWIITQKTEYYLMCLRDSLGQYAFKKEMASEKLLGFPYKISTEVGTFYGKYFRNYIYVKGSDGDGNNIDNLEPVYFVKTF